MTGISAEDLAIETWTWWSIGIILIVGRLVSRSLQRGGVKGLQVEDYLMVFATFTYTGSVVLLNQIYLSDTNLVLPGDDLAQESQDHIASRILGSKLAFIEEQCALATVWVTKGCMLLLYHRLTSLLGQHIMVEVLAVYCVVGYLTIEITLFAVWCRPVTQYWAVPVTNEQCATYEHHLINSAVWNISSDLMILGIPLPMLFQMRIPILRKLVLCSVFGIGLFAVAAACTSKAFYFAHPLDPSWPFWAVRESSSAIYVANLPFWWTLLQRILPLSSFSSTGSKATTKKSLLAKSQASNVLPEGSHALPKLRLNGSELEMEEGR